METLKLTHEAKVEALNAFLSDDLSYDAECLQMAIKDFLELGANADPCAVEKEEFVDLLYNYADHYQHKKETERLVSEHKRQGRTEQTEVDISQTTNSDQIGMALDLLRGLKALLGAMAVANDAGEHKYQLQAFEALENICADVLKRFEDISGQVDYMEDRIRMCTT